MDCTWGAPIAGLAAASALTTSDGINTETFFTACGLCEPTCRREGNGVSSVSR